jgi:hypothetical protein
MGDAILGSAGFGTRTLINANESWKLFRATCPRRAAFRRQGHASDACAHALHLLLTIRPTSHASCCNQHDHMHLLDASLLSSTPASTAAQLLSNASLLDTCPYLHYSISQSIAPLAASSLLPNSTPLLARSSYFAPHRPHHLASKRLSRLRSSLFQSPASCTRGISRTP